MAKSKRGKMSSRMKKTIRRAVGGVLLISALIVAFIPEREAKADPIEPPLVTLGPTDSSIPVISTSDEIYTTGDGAFQFAYVNKNSGGDKVAVIVGYDYERSLSGGTLTIPETVDAYIKGTHAQGTSGGYVAIGKSGNPLYYPVYTTGLVDSGEVDSNGDPIMVEGKIISSYKPCLFIEHDIWIKSDDGTRPRAANEFYFYDSTQNKYFLTTDEEHQRIMNAVVAYISSQHAERSGDTWQLSTEKNVGIFSKAANIVNLVTGENLLGIGDYAFYQCANLKGITLGNGANTIGNYAFANCINLETANLPLNSSLLAIGDHAFNNCQKLQNFTVPVAVRKIGDSAFEGCTSMTEFKMSDSSYQVNLNLIGKNMFKNCYSLEQIEFHEFFTQQIPLSYFSGCSALDYIKIQNSSMKLVADATMSFNDFTAMVKPEFYFEGKDESEIHSIATTNGIAFKYMTQELYEKVFTASGDAGTGVVVYRVDNKDTLQYFYMDNTVLEVELPETIGPYSITSIGSDSFQNNHNLKKITIPSSIVAIEDNAFKGCHRLKDVIFTEPIQLQSIGDGAFDTQVVDPLLDSCTLSTKPVLTFTGVISPDSVPYNYAMNSANNINRGSQQLSYITFYSGWPQNLSVEYNLEKNRAELIDYPRLTDLISYTSADYPYISSEQAAAANAAYVKYQNGDALTEDENDIINAALNIELPNGIRGIKEGIFSGVDEEGNTISSIPVNGDIQTIKTQNMEKVDPYTFAGCTEMIGVYIQGDTPEIGDFAFNGCSSLVDADITSSLVTMGKRPFKGCTKLEEIDFSDSTNFVCADGLVFGLKDSQKENLLECLESRGVTYKTGAITSDELGQTAAIVEEAFRGCPGILSADFSKSKIETVPIGCFEDTQNLYSVTLPDTCKKIGKTSFKDSNIRYVDIPNSVNIIDPSAFENDIQNITFYCQEDSMAADFAEDYSNISVQEKAITYKVTFYDEDASTILDTKYVEAGKKAETTVSPTKEGYRFKGWAPNVDSVTSDLNTYATYETDDKTYTVTFIGYDDKELYVQHVKENENAIEPAGPARSGYKFTGWRPAITNITKDVITYAQYELETQASSSGNSSSSGSSSGSAASLYTLTVIDGSGGGSYAKDATVTIKANTPVSGKEFDKWTCDNSAVTFASATTATTTIKMPESALTVTATYKDSTVKQSSSGGNSTTSASNGSSSTNTTNKPAATTVDVNKPGISNKDAASATVNGSTDNYVVKISDSSSAKKEVEEALKEKYGTLENIEYFAMDISLYDQTGSKKVENTDGLSVTITIPIPDDLVKYAGNNKAAYVVNGKLLELQPKYTTINGVACVTFTATHFSPYTIYVDTSDLKAGTELDSTPKTGDGISPKWFLALGLFCVSVVLFSIRDKKRVASPAK